MKLVKNLSVAILSTGFIVLATAAQALSVTLEYNRDIGSPGLAPGQLLVPQGITVQPETGNVFVSNGGNDRLDVFDSQGNFLKTIGERGEGPGQFREPSDLKFDMALHMGNLLDLRAYQYLQKLEIYM